MSVFAQILLAVAMLAIALCVQVKITRRHFRKIESQQPKIIVQYRDRPLPPDYDFTQDTIARIDRELALHARRQHHERVGYDPDAFDSHDDYVELIDDDEYVLTDHCGNVIKRYTA